MLSTLNKKDFWANLKEERFAKVRTTSARPNRDFGKDSFPKEIVGYSGPSTIEDACAQMLDIMSLLSIKQNSGRALKLLTAVLIGFKVPNGTDSAGEIAGKTAIRAFCSYEELPNSKLATELKELMSTDLNRTLLEADITKMNDDGGEGILNFAEVDKAQGKDLKPALARSKTDLSLSKWVSAARVALNSKAYSPVDLYKALYFYGLCLYQTVKRSAEKVATFMTKSTANLLSGMFYIDTVEGISIGKQTLVSCKEHLGPGSSMIKQMMVVGVVMSKQPSELADFWIMGFTMRTTFTGMPTVGVVLSIAKTYQMSPYSVLASLACKQTESTARAIVSWVTRFYAEEEETRVKMDAARAEEDDQIIDLSDFAPYARAMDTSVFNELASMQNIFFMSIAARILAGSGSTIPIVVKTLEGELSSVAQAIGEAFIRKYAVVEADEDASDLVKQAIGKIRGGKGDRKPKPPPAPKPLPKPTGFTFASARDSLYD